MCGIVGSINYKLNNEKIKDVMYHRGPDEQNDYLADNVDLYHLRLSIMDIGGGKQPMHYKDRYTIIFNGEIYNHAILREQFQLKGSSHSDTETLLMLYDKMGADMLHHLDGMFALAIYDKEQKKIFIARDRAGKKPLYLFKDNAKIVFASELNCLNNLLTLEINTENFYSYMRLGSFYRKFTPYKNVTELAAGTHLLIDCTTLAIKETRWWDIADYYNKNNPDSFEDSLKKTELFLDEAIKNRLDTSDLEVGCFLSGGIDSGLVTAIASKYRRNLKTFTVSFEGEYNEAPLAKLVADKYQTDHTEINISFDHLLDDVEQIISNYGEPFADSSAIPSYYVSREAKKHLTVILNGDGADELFGGYRRYVPFANYDFFKSPAIIKQTAKMITNILPAPHNKKTKYNYIHRLFSLASKSKVDTYISAGADIMEGYEHHFINEGANYMQQIENDFQKICASANSGFRKIINMDFDSNLFSDLLVKMDIATMANSLEGRSPFLCKNLLEYIPSVNDKYKVDGSTTKVLLRTLAKTYLPETLVNQPKRGFEIPLKNWIDNELKDMIFDYLNAPNSFSGQFINRNFVQDLLHKKIKISDEKRSKTLWTLFCMEVWYKKSYLKQ
jgi:asparagine synthase (glutamine-hydrolysing)